MGKTIKRLLVLVGLVASTLLLCTCWDDASVTCGNYDRFLQRCTSSCSPTWDCVENYDYLSISEQLDLDECSDCLVSNPGCGDCSTQYVGSCRDFMEHFLGVDCW